MHFVGMTAAKFVIIDGKLDFELGSENYIVEKETSAIAAIIAAMLFLWALMFMNIADLRRWFYERSKTLKSIANLMDEIEKNAVQTEFSKRIVRKYNAINGVQQSAPSAVDFFGYFSVDNFLSSESSGGGRMSTAGSRAGSFAHIRALSTSECTFEDGKQSQPSRQLCATLNSSSKAHIKSNTPIQSRSNSIEKMTISGRSTSLPNISSHTTENLKSHISVTSNYDLTIYSNVNRDLSPLIEKNSDSQDDGRIVPSLILLPRDPNHSLRLPKIFSSLRIAPMITLSHTPESLDSIRKL